MSVVTLFSGVFCSEDEVVQDIIESTGYQHINDDKVVLEASEFSNISKEILRRSFSSKTSVFNRFTQEKERSAAFLRLAAARLIQQDNVVLSGFSGHLIPKILTHVIRVLLIAKSSYRRSTASQKQNFSDNEAEQFILMDDHQRSEWVKQLHGINDPWDKNLYDIVIPMDTTNTAKAAALIKSYLYDQTVEISDSSNDLVRDFILACEVETALAAAGHIVKVEAEKGAVSLIMNQQVLMLGRLEKELKSIVEGIPGVESVNTRVEKNLHENHSYRRYNFDMPSKVLLVDDEREFVQTLSERLQMREMGSVVAYDGPSALELVRNDEPEVMIVDLKLPGMDGMEILDQVKQINSDIEVIILTGHGSEQDREKCLELGAFAYMQKPVDISTLSQTLKQAHEKIRTGH